MNLLLLGFYRLPLALTTECGSVRKGPVDVKYRGSDVDTYEKTVQLDIRGSQQRHHQHHEQHNTYSLKMYVEVCHSVSPPILVCFGFHFLNFNSNTASIQYQFQVYALVVQQSYIFLSAHHKIYTLNSLCHFTPHLPSVCQPSACSLQLSLIFGLTLFFPFFYLFNFLHSTHE